MSVVGPGPRAMKNWARARAAGLATMAKTQFNNTWEISTRPVHPRDGPDPRTLRASAAGGYQRTDGVMDLRWIRLSESRGGESLLLRSAAEQGRNPEGGRGAALREGRRVGHGAGLASVQRRVPGVPIRGPRLYDSDAARSGESAPPPRHGVSRRDHALSRTTIVKGWSGQYPPEVAQKQFAKTAALWKVGVESMERALDRKCRRARGDTPNWISQSRRLASIISRAPANQFDSLSPSSDGGAETPVSG